MSYLVATNGTGKARACQVPGKGKPGGLPQGGQPLRAGLVASRLKAACSGRGAWLPVSLADAKRDRRSRAGGTGMILRKITGVFTSGGEIPYLLSDGQPECCPDNEWGRSLD